MWSFQHSVEAPVGKDFAWQFWTNVENWARVDPAVEWAKLDGPFSAGARGTTKPLGYDPTQWLITDVEDGKTATLEIAAPGVIFRFRWVFEETDSGGTRISQEAGLEGERAEEFVEAMRGFEEGIPAGMQKLVEAIMQSAEKAV